MTHPAADAPADDASDASHPRLRETPLHARHVALGATLTDFGGWSMPVRYGSDLAEHRAVRETAGLFDISHMAELVVEGSDAGAFLDHALAGRLSTLPVGKAKYSLLLAESGGILDDVIVYRLADDWFVVIANAGNREVVADALRERLASFTPARPPAAGSSFAFVAGTHVRVEDASDVTALVAVQGPRAREVLVAVDALLLRTTARRLGEPDTAWELADLPYYAARIAQFDGVQVLIARTGYTGEDGYELAVPAPHAVALWDALLAAGEPLGLVPAGLAARDTLRLEAGMPLYGHELSLDVVPAQAGLARAVALDKDDFVGKAGLSAVVAADAPVLVGLVSEGRRAGRAGYAVLDADADNGAVVGEVTSGALSPTLRHPIAMAFVRPACAEPGTRLFIDVRGTRVPATVTDLPFYRRQR